MTKIFMRKDLPIEIVHRLRIDDVQQVTSKLTQRSHIAGVSLHEDDNSYVKASGITRIATQRSDIASETCQNKTNFVKNNTKKR